MIRFVSTLLGYKPVLMLSHTLNALGLAYTVLYFQSLLFRRLHVVYVWRQVNYHFLSHYNRGTEK